MDRTMREYPDREGFECCDHCGKHLVLDRKTGELCCPNGCNQKEEEAQEEEE